MFLRVLMVAALVVAAMAVQLTSNNGSDSTLIPGTKGAVIVEQVITNIKTSCVFPDDKLFMRRLAFVESSDGADTKTFRTGYNGGIWQVDEAMFNKIKEPQSHQALSIYTNKITIAFGKDWQDTTWQDCRKPLFSALAARLYIQLFIDLIGTDFPRDITAQGSIWASYYRNGADANIFKNAVQTLSKGCKVSGIDLIFILDSSGSIGSSNFVDMKDFVKDVVNSFDIGINKTQVGVFTYSSSVNNLDFYLNTYQTKAHVLAAVSGIMYSGGTPNTHLALDFSHQTMFTTAKGARNPATGVPRVGVFLTDGQSNNATLTEVSALNVHKAGITMISVGIGTNTRTTELEAIASTPVCLNLVRLGNFTELASLNYAIEDVACDAPVITSPGVNGTKLNIKASSEGQNLQVKVPIGGATIQIIAKDGKVILYVSTITYPSEAFYDAMVSAVPGIPGVIFIQKPPTSDPEGIVYCNIKDDTHNQTHSEVEVGIIPGGVPFDCSENNNPCNMANRNAGKYYFAHTDPTNFVQCDEVGECYVVPCPTGEIWNHPVDTCTLPTTTTPPAP